jgi:protein-disulfide isomerase
LKVEVASKGDLTNASIFLGGDPKADLTIIEFADFQCPPCQQTNVLSKEVIVKDGSRAVFYFQNKPLEMHELAKPLALLSYVVPPSMYGEFHDSAFKVTKSSFPEFERKWKAKISGNADVLATALIITAEKKLRMSLQISVELDIKATPSFMVWNRKEDHAYKCNSLEQVQQVLAGL